MQFVIHNVSKSIKYERHIFLSNHSRLSEFRVSSYIVSDGTKKETVIGGITDVHEGWYVQPGLKIDIVIKLIEELRLNCSAAYHIGIKNIQEFSGDYYINDTYIESGTARGKGVKFIATVGLSLLLLNK